MNTLISPLIHKLTLLSLGLLTFVCNPVTANTDKQAMREVQIARELARRGKNHSQHKKPVDKDQQFRGVYYGYLPCKHCAGIKMTLSLKNKKNYLLVTQYAQASTKEFYEKGKYTWDDKSGLVTLTSRKDSNIRKLRIKNDGALIMLSFDGVDMKNNQKEYTLLRSDKNKSREVHIH